MFKKKWLYIFKFTQNLIFLSPYFYSIKSYSYYAEIYEEDNKLLIVSFNNKEDFFFIMVHKKFKKKYNFMNDFNISFYKSIKLKNFNKTIFTTTCF